jgi:ABC-type branched-subunit amino acid transport system ATPase component/branched-subunit amino acid ABC-type transport system permease component
MDKLLTIVLSGLVSGAIYSLIASGLVLARSTSGIFNFAHGAVAFCAAYLFYELNTGLGMPVLPSAVLAAVVMPILMGLFLNKILFRHLATSSDEAKIVATVGLMIALPALALALLDIINSLGADLPTGENVFIAPGLGPVPKTNWAITDTLVIDSNQVVVLVAATVCAVGLWVLLRFTRLGLRMRAGIDRKELASLRGIDPDRTSAVAWALSMVLAGVAGVVGAPLFGLAPDTYTTILFVASAAAVAARLTSIPIAFGAGLGLAVLQNVVAGYLPIAQKVTGLGASVPFLALLLALWFLGRERVRRAGTAAESADVVDHADDLPAWRRTLPWAVASVALLGFLLFGADRYWAGLITSGLALSLVFLSFVVVTGIGGMVSLAQASFVSVAAVTAGLMLAHGVPFPLAVLLGALAGAGLGVVIAAPGLRLGSLAFSLATLALAFIVDKVVLQMQWFGGGVAGRPIDRPKYGPIDLADERVFGLLLFALVLLVVWMIRNLGRTASGRAMRAVRSSEAAAAAVGISHVRAKLSVFAVSAGIAGIGGVLMASAAGQVTPQSYPASVGLLWLAVVVTFGVRHPGGAVLAGIAFALGPEVISWFTESTRLPTILFGLGAINLATNPDGMMAQTSRSLRVIRDRLRRVRGRAAVSVTAPGGAIDHQEQHAAGSATGAETGTFVVRGLDSGYGATGVLHGLSVTLRRGSVTAVLGPNGAGKSTLAKTLAGLVPATRGSVLLEGVAIDTWPAHRRARAGVVLAPESRGIFPGLTVRENLEVWLTDRRQIDEVMARFPALAGRSSVTAGHLSGGEQQMLALGSLLVRPPEVLIVDEPSLGLAPLVVADIMTVFEELRDRGVAILLIEEKATDALRVADDVLIVESGKVQWFGPAASVDRSVAAGAYLGAATT